MHPVVGVRRHGAVAQEIVLDANRPVHGEGLSLFGADRHRILALSFPAEEKI
jgi:hypothetical protein